MILPFVGGSKKHARTKKLITPVNPMNNSQFGDLKLSRLITEVDINLPTLACKELPNGMRYLRWGGDGEAVQPEKR